MCCWGFFFFHLCLYIYLSRLRYVYVCVFICSGMPIFCFFPLFLARSVLRRSVSRFLFSPISFFSFWTFCLFLCSFSVRRHAHVDFQLFSQKSSGIPVCMSVSVLQAANGGPGQESPDQQWFWRQQWRRWGCGSTSRHSWRLHPAPGESADQAVCV